MNPVAVVIPYFQRKPGILRRALTSLLQQRLPQNTAVNVIVVDDGSPVSARMEIENLNFSAPFALKLIEQKNAGVAAARDAGLHSISADTTYIAFLDSDDIWEPEHLAAALATLEQGFDCYFCDNRRIGQYESQLSTLIDGNFFAATKASAIGDDVYELDKQAFYKCCLRTFVCQLSTVVYRRASAANLLFDASLHTAGEDSLFMLQLAERSRRIACTSRIYVTCADGVNIYYSKLSWEDPGHLIRYMGIISMYYKFLQQLSLSAEDRDYIARHLTFRRRDFAFLTARYFLKKRELWPDELVKMTQQDKTFWLWYPLSVLYVMALFPLRLYSPLKE